MTSRPSHRLLALLACLVGWFGIAVMVAGPASAHVQIISSTPAEGTRLAEAPARISIKLSENIGIQPGSVKVVDTRGNEVDDGTVFQPGEDAQEVAIKLRPGVGAGSYVVNYAFVSEDSHPVRGAFAFVVGDGPLLNATGAVSGSDGTDGTVDALFAAFKWASFCGIVLLGGLVFVVYCRSAGRGDPRARRLIRAGCTVSAVTAVAAFFLQGVYVAGQGLSSVFSPELMEATLRTPYGKLLLLRLVAVAALAVLSKRLLVPGPLPERVRFRYENLTMVAGFVVLLSFSAAGHAVADKLMYFSLGADLIHLSAMAVWVGGLVQLALWLFRPAVGEDLERVLARFSPMATSAVVAMALTGTYLALRTVPSAAALFTTAYGILLLAKLAGFGVLLVAAEASRKAVRRAVANQSFPEGGSALATVTMRTLRQTVGAELLIATVVLALAALLSSTSPTV